MWTGGVRAIVFDEEDRLLMVSQAHENREIWMLPGGGIEDFENSAEAVKREIFEETGLLVETKELVWHVEEVSRMRGQRFVNYFLAEIAGGKLELGKDPELSQSGQVLRDAKFFKREEIKLLDHVHPDFLKNETDDIFALSKKGSAKKHHVYRIRDNFRV